MLMVRFEIVMAALAMPLLTTGAAGQGVEGSHHVIRHNRFGAFIDWNTLVSCEGE